MSDDATSGKTEIVIVRRRGGDDLTAAKGGAWKIAYADFVTAMMAFFLVMWLINASNEETRAQVASYFNPIKLTDTSTGSRSLKDMKDTRNPQNTDHGAAGEGTPPSKKDSKEEAEMLANPPKSLDRVAKTVADAEFRNSGLESTQEIAPSLKPDKANPGVGDPFDPKSWEKAAPAPVPAAETPAKPEADAKEKTSEQTEQKTTPPLPKPKPAAEEKAMEGKPAEDAHAAFEREAKELTQEIAQRLGKSGGELPGGLEVKATDKGVLVSLTESASFEMFKTGSAEPEPALLKLVEAIAGAVKSRTGYIVIRGHTDARPYRNKYYDNWQLSTARAHLARYMLIRGGLDESRIRRVEGVADREPRNTQDPQAPENRRIEILIGNAEP